jgi:hypothetical protein
LGLEIKKYYSKIQPMPWPIVRGRPSKYLYLVLFVHQLTKGVGLTPLHIMRAFISFLLSEYLNCHKWRNQRPYLNI